MPIINHWILYNVYQRVMGELNFFMAVEDDWTPEQDARVGQLYAVKELVCAMYWHLNN